MKKLVVFLLVLFVSALAHAGSFVCLDDVTPRCAPFAGDMLDAFSYLNAYGNEVGGKYTITADRANNSVTIRFENGRAIVRTLERMSDQKIVQKVRPTILERLHLSK